MASDARDLEMRRLARDHLVQELADANVAAALALPEAKGREAYAEFLARTTCQPPDRIRMMLRRQEPKNFTKLLSFSKQNDLQNVWPENRPENRLPAASARKAVAMPVRRVSSETLVQRLARLPSQSDVPLNPRTRYIEPKAASEARRFAVLTDRRGSISGSGADQSVPAVATAKADQSKRGLRVSRALPSAATSAAWDEVISEINSEIKR